MARLTMHTHYRGWQVVVTRGRPCLGSAGRSRPPLEIITARGPDRNQVRKELHDRIDAFEAGLAATPPEPAAAVGPDQTSAHPPPVVARPLALPRQRARELGEAD